MWRFTKILKNLRNFNVFWEAWEVLASPRRAQDAPKRREDGLRRRQGVPKMGKYGSKALRRHVKMHPSRRQIQNLNIYENIKKLEPGSILELDLNNLKVSISKFWDLEKIPNKLNLNYKKTKENVQSPRGRPHNAAQARKACRAEPS